MKKRTTDHLQQELMDSPDLARFLTKNEVILFAPHAFAPHRQLPSSYPPSPLVFFLISTYFTATQGIPITSPVLKTYSFKCSLEVKPPDFTSDLPARLHALYTQ